MAHETVKFADDLKVGDEIGLYFDVGVIENSLYGSADKLSGVVPLLLPFGDYTQPILLEDAERYEKFIQRKAIEFSDVYPNDLHEDIVNKIRYSITFVSQLGPDYELNDPKYEAVSTLAIAIAAGDDILDNLSDGERMNFSEIHKINESVVDLINGVYKSSDDIPNLVEALVPFNYLMWKATDLSIKAMPDYTQRNKDFIIEVQNSGLSNILLTQSGAEIGGETCFSPHSRVVFGCHNNGILCCLEYMAVTKGIQLSDKIQRNVLFQRLRVSAGCAMHAVNNVYGIGRDIRLHQVKDSNILTNVTSNGVELQTAFDTEFNELIQHTNDVKIALKLLREGFRHDTHLMKYLRCLETVVDGQIYFYARTTRYGHLTAKIVKINKQ